MYINNNSTIVEINTVLPINFQLPSTVLGMTNWDVVIVNKDDGTVHKLTPSDFSVSEIGEFTNRAEVNGEYQAGSMTVKVDDSSLLESDQIIRIGNHCYTIVDVNKANHLLTLDKPTQSSIANLTPVQSVQYPALLGHYRTVNLAIDRLGNFLVILMDKDNEVANIVSEVSVVRTLQTVTSNGGSKIYPLSATNSIIG